MKSQTVSVVMAVLGLIAVIRVPMAAAAADADWKAVEQALGGAGQLQPGDVFRVGMPRTDRNVTVKGSPVKPSIALGSYAAFKQEGDHAMVMGDLVLLDAEVPAVMSGLFAGGLEVTAVHNHAVQLAKGLRQALSATDDPAKLAQGLKSALDLTNSRR